MIKRGDHWEAVGTTGSYDHAQSELADWIRDCPDADFALGRRVIPEWHVTDRYPARNRES